MVRSRWITTNCREIIGPLRLPSEGTRVTVYERGHVRIPDVIPTATKQQVAKWRSAIVEILVSGKAEGTVDGQQTVGFGVIVGADGTLVST